MARVEFVYVIRAINEIFEDICKVSDWSFVIS